MKKISQKLNETFTDIKTKRYSFCDRNQDRNPQETSVTKVLNPFVILAPNKYTICFSIILSSKRIENSMT